MRDRFVLSREENILFINFAGLRIEGREQVDEFARLVAEAYRTQGRRLYAVVDYEGTEIAPEIIDYYGEVIKELQDRYAIRTVRYSSSGFTRSMLRYLGAAKGLESNAYATREEAIRAIQELESRSLAGRRATLWAMLNPRRSLLGKLLSAWLVIIIALGLILVSSTAFTDDPHGLAVLRASMAAAMLALLVGATVSGVVLYLTSIKPLRQMERAVRRLTVAGVFEPIEAGSDDEISRLTSALDEAALQLRRDIERLSGLYHISLMIGTGTDLAKICELLTRKIARLLGAEMCVILLYDEREQCIRVQLPAYGMRDERLELLGSEINEKSIASLVLKTNEPYLANDLSTDPLVSNAAAELLGTKSILAVPLQAGERAFGAIEVMNKEGGFVEEDRRLVTIFASQAAQLLANAQLFEQVRESEERYRQIFESALDGLYRGATDGRLATVNPALASMLGYERAEELIDRNLFAELFAESSCIARLIEELNEHGQALDVECQLRRKTGEMMPARISIRVVRDKSNESYHLGIIKDITEQKKLSEQLIISERLAVVGELIAGVAHEVRNPLFGITTTLSALSRRLEEREAVKPFLDVVMTEADRLNHLMEQLLEHSRPVRLDSNVADIRSVIQEVIGEFSSQAREKNVAVNLDCPHSVPGLRIDRRKMHGVFANLVDNALQHTPAGGRVEVVVESENGRHELQIELSDTGAGIAPENLSKVFDPFFTTRAAGTGLGLAIARKTVHDHGGTIAVRSEVGKGTSFRINLPIETNGGNK